MEFSTKIIKILCILQGTVLSILLLPISMKVKIFICRPISFNSSILYKGIFIIYILISVVFVDCLLKKHEDLVMTLYNLNNLYISGFTLYLAFVLFATSSTLNSLSKLQSNIEKEKVQIEILKKQVGNQKPFVDKLLDDLAALGKDLDSKDKDLRAAKNMLKQLKNNENAYFDLLEKYNQLKNAREPKKIQ